MQMSREDLEALIKIANLNEPVIDAAMLQAVLNFEVNDIHPKSVIRNALNPKSAFEPYYLGNFS